MEEIIHTHIGRFMVAVGTILENTRTNKILVAKRKKQDFRQGEWEVVYGRVDQHEELEDGLKRELYEELGVSDLTIKKIMRVWHIYRGEKSADKEIFGFTFYCQTNQESFSLSEEHSEYQWVTPEEALSLIKVEGIRQDIEHFIKHRDSLTLAITTLDNQTKTY